MGDSNNKCSKKLLNLEAVESIWIKADESFLRKEDAVGRKNDSHGEIFNSYEGEYQNIASGPYSHAEGFNTQATGLKSHAENEHTAAIGRFSHAEGNNTSATGDSSHTEGYGTKTLNTGEHAEGRFNISHGEFPVIGDTHINHTISSIGIGNDDLNRRNAVEVMVNGDMYVKGVGLYDGINVEGSNSLQKIISKLESSSGEGGQEIVDIKNRLDEYDRLELSDGLHIVEGLDNKKYIDINLNADDESLIINENNQLVINKIDLGEF